MAVQEYNSATSLVLVGVVELRKLKTTLKKEGGRQCNVKKKRLKNNAVQFFKV
jgi:hypothetical protein